jgi:hypothetical protein
MADSEIPDDEKVLRIRGGLALAELERAQEANEQTGAALRLARATLGWALSSEADAS